MDKVKNKYELILGFATFIIALGAFKEEFQNFIVNLGFITFSLYTYGFVIVCGLAFCIYLYILEKILSDLKFIRNWKIFYFITQMAYFMFVLIFLTPIIILVIDIGYKYFLQDNTVFIKIFSFVYGVFSGMISFLLALLASKKILQFKHQKIQAVFELEEIKALENALKFFEQGYYSHSILECFKVLELHLHRELIRQKVYPPTSEISYLIKLALKEKIINTSDLNTINELQAIRNLATHSNVKHNENQASSALHFIRSLINKDSND